MARKKQKSIWKSKSFLTGIGSIVTAISLKYGIDIPPVVIEGILAAIASVLIGKSFSKRTGK